MRDTFREVAQFQPEADSPLAKAPSVLPDKEKILDFFREVAQLASVRALGAWGPGFESRLPDHTKKGLHKSAGLSLCAGE